MKKCIKCNDPKSEDRFNVNRSKSDGLESMCRDCMRSYKKLYNKTPSGKLVNELSIKKYMSSKKGKENKKRYKSSIEGRALIKADQKRMIAKYSNAHKCRYRTKYLIRKGELNRPNNCDECNLICKPQGHHCDYNKPSDIIWLCVGCHRDWHKNNTPLNRADGIFTRGI